MFFCKIGGRGFEILKFTLSCGKQVKVINERKKTFQNGNAFITV